ncbi:MAG TPA: hypothetical protein VJN95_02125 [Gemmatimonadales bacterium]|nr:hypothetical protein [Gemmatimonadales bacterium]
MSPATAMSGVVLLGALAIRPVVGLVLLTQWGPAASSPPADHCSEPLHSRAPSATEAEPVAGSSANAV